MNTKFNAKKLYRWLAGMLTCLPYSRKLSLLVDRLIVLSERTDFEK